MKGIRTAGWLLGLSVLGTAMVPAYAGDSFYGRVTAVKEPTLVTLVQGANSYDIRLVGVEAPRAGEPHAAEALRYVTDLLLGKNARMRLHRRAPNGEMLCRLFTDDPVIGIQEVGVELVRAGLARRQPDYDEKYGELSAAENEARAAQRGIWAPAPSK